MTNSVFDKSFKQDEIDKLKSVLNSCVVSLQHIEDIREQMKEIVQEAADELEIKSAEINKAAKALHKQNIASARSAVEAVEELLQVAGFDTSGDLDA